MAEETRESLVGFYFSGGRCRVVWPQQVGEDDDLGLDAANLNCFLDVFNEGLFGDYVAGLTDPKKMRQFAGCVCGVCTHPFCTRC